MCLRLRRQKKKKWKEKGQSMLEEVCRAWNRWTMQNRWDGFNVKRVNKLKLREE